MATMEKCEEKPKTKWYVLIGLKKFNYLKAKLKLIEISTGEILYELENAEEDDTETRAYEYATSCDLVLKSIGEELEDYKENNRREL